jgi:hypothetical protein
MEFPRNPRSPTLLGDIAHTRGLAFAIAHALSWEAPHASSSREKGADRGIPFAGGFYIG